MSVVGERLYRSEVYGVSRDGAIGSENVGMSNHNDSEILSRRKPKVSLAMSISQGLGGPKPNPKGVGDGQPVNIPAPERKILEKDAVKVFGRIIGFPTPH